MKPSVSRLITVSGLVVFGLLVLSVVTYAFDSPERNVQAKFLDAMEWITVAWTAVVLVLAIRKFRSLRRSTWPVLMLNAIVTVLLVITFLQEK